MKMKLNHQRYLNLEKRDASVGYAVKNSFKILEPVSSIWNEIFLLKLSDSISPVTSANSCSSINIFVDASYSIGGENFRTRRFSKFDFVCRFNLEWTE